MVSDASPQRFDSAREKIPGDETVNDDKDEPSCH
jgi:hypothetical protein